MAEDLGEGGAVRHILLAVVAERASQSGHASRSAARDHEGNDRDGEPAARLRRRYGARRLDLAGEVERVDEEQGYQPAMADVAGAPDSTMTTRSSVATTSIRTSRLRPLAFRMPCVANRPAECDKEDNQRRQADRRDGLDQR